MNALKPIWGLVAACAACCAISITFPLALGVAGSFSAVFGFTTLAIAAGGAMLSTLLIVRTRRRGCGTKSKACAIAPRSSS